MRQRKEKAIARSEGEPVWRSQLFLLTERWQKKTGGCGTFYAKPQEEAGTKEELHRIKVIGRWHRTPALAIRTAWNRGFWKFRETYPSYRW
jgi:hypothetical protein